MKSQEKQNEIWIIASLAAPIAHIASGLTWSSVAAASLLAVGIRKLMQKRKENKITAVLKSGCLIVFLGLSLQWMKQCWRNQRDIEWIMSILLLLAAFLVSKGKESTINAAMVLWWMTAFLLGSVLISAIKEIRVKNLLVIYERNRNYGFLKLLLILILPALREDRRKIPVTGASLTAVAALFSICSGGVLTSAYAGSTPSPFYELSRSVRLYGILDRMEAMAWLGMMLGTFLYMSYMLRCIAKTEEIQGRNKYIMIGLAIFWSGLCEFYA